ncbi:hypothetical protein UAS_01318 [Enterococcus asini ATCC 700915]|uniref:Glycosyl transferase family 1 domain-containing protein n=1 Tax=Enterococcus asini ATCC 700915 TaxID=1158606 RepID=R2S1Z4_9ENTE|nr:glycosyltransferase [Enterococcus asini]EOH86856.1 hypothetical protein UAS_01318 [Enterococcus asini ATCC 700915]EOT58221.1 hypothetical protein I579_01784 [Enterococcus asini ATCC 700915]
MLPIEEIEKKFYNKKILFISTKNLDYIRNTQEINWLKGLASEIEIICHPSNNYFIRLFFVYLKLLPKLIKRDFDGLFLGFAPQLLFPYFPFLPKNKLIVMDFFISFYDTLVDDRKKIKDNTFFSKALHFWDRKTLEKADCVVVDTKAHGEFFSEEFRINKRKIGVLYIEADSSIYQPHPREKNAKFEVIYFGSILPVQGIQVILDALKLLNNHSEIHFTLIGPIGSKFQVNEMDFPNVTFIPWVTQKDLAEYINQADLALSGHFSSTVGKANRTIAGKTYIYLAMQKKIILGDSDANRELYKPSTNIFYVERGNPQALANLIMDISSGNP